MYRCFSLLMGVWKDSKTFVLGYAIYVSNAYMVPFQAFCSLVTQWLRCIVGNLGATLEKLVNLDSYNTAGPIMDWIDTAEPEISLFSHHAFFVLAPTLPTTQLTTEWHHWRQIMRRHATSTGATEGFRPLSAVAFQCYSKDFLVKFFWTKMTFGEDLSTPIHSYTWKCSEKVPAMIKTPSDGSWNSSSSSTVQW